MDDSPSLAVPKALEHGCAAVQVGGIERTVTPMRYRRRKDIKSIVHIYTSCLFPRGKCHP